MNFYLLAQAVVLSLQELWNHRLRSSLSLLGITIGVFCIISVFTAVDSLQKNITDSLSSFGENVVYISKWPWDFGNDYPWWEYYKRPITSEDEMEAVAERSKLGEAFCIMYRDEGVNISKDNYAIDADAVMGVTYDFVRIKDLKLQEGRYISASEMQSAASVIVLGNKVAETLFPQMEEVSGQSVSLYGRKFIVCGVVRKEGSDIINNSLDRAALIPYKTLALLKDPRFNWDGEPMLACMAKKDIPLEEFKYELRGIVRSLRAQKPGDADNFAMNQVSMLSSMTDGILSMVKVVGLAIGAFSAFIGCFGVANIMFVSVKERTRQIGIKKAIGAKRSTILMEFLIEATILSILGGIIGLVLVFILSLILTKVTSQGDFRFTFSVSMTNVVLGLLIASASGIIAGIIPAIKASGLRPVDAIRS